MRLSMSQRAVLCLGVAAVSVTAAAQPAVEEIIVTARKRGESLIDVPVAITALTAETLDMKGIKDYNNLNDFVPGLRYENSAANRSDRGFHTITMRGMYPGDSPNRQAVTAFVDGTPIPGGAIGGLTDIERVEVVNGPQSAYFGRSTFAGAINFITRAPSYDTIGSIDASFGSFNTLDVTGKVEGGLVPDKFAARASVRYYDTDGRYDNAGRPGKLGARKTLSGAVNLLAEPSDDLRIRGYFTMWRDSDGPSAQAALNELDYNCNPGGTGRQVNGRNFVCGGIASFPVARAAQNSTPPINLGGITALASTILKPSFIDGLGLERREYQSLITADYTVNDYTISGSFGKNQNKWAAMTETYNRPPEPTNYFRYVYLPYNIDNHSAELRVASPAEEKFNFLLGANYYHESIFFGGFAAAAPATAAPTTLTVPTEYLADTTGLFGSATYDFTEQVSLTGEARYQWDEIEHVQRTATGFGSKKTFKSFSPRVILNYAFADNASTYLSFARGTRPGTFNINFLSLSQFARDQVTTAFGAVPLAIDEETLRTYEAGLKGDFADGRVRVLAAAYYGEWRDRQINQNFLYRATPTATTNSSITLTLANGSVNLRGLELQWTFKATDALTFDGTLNWAETDIRNTQCAECVAITGIINPIGNQMERYPAESGTIGVSYEQPINDTWTGLFRMDMIYTGRQYATAANVVWTKGTQRFNARIGASTEAYTVELFGKNIFNDKTPSNILRNGNPNANPAQGLNLVILAPPEARQFGIRAKVGF